MLAVPGWFLSAYEPKPPGLVSSTLISYSKKWHTIAVQHALYIIHERRAKEKDILLAKANNNTGSTVHAPGTTVAKSCGLAGQGWGGGGLLLLLRAMEECCCGGATKPWTPVQPSRGKIQTSGLVPLTHT
jgi:hypothetical protein